MVFLPDPAELALGPFPATVVAVPVPPEGLTLYRLVRAVPPVEADFAARTAALSVGGQTVLLRSAISAFLTPASAIRSRRRPASRLAELHLVPDPLVHVARTTRIAHGEHVCVWGPRRRLLRCVVRCW